MRVHTARILSLVIVSAAAVLSACRARPSEELAIAAQATCDSTKGVLPAGATLSGQPGEYELEMVATSGSKAGRVARGKLILESSKRPATPQASYPLEGMTDVSLANVGAEAPGSTLSRDPARPGVLVLEYPRPGATNGARDLTIRFGADANDRAVRFDGAFTALHVGAVSAGGIRGRWTSESSAGFFCAAQRGGQRA